MSRHARAGSRVGLGLVLCAVMGAASLAMAADPQQAPGLRGTWRLDRAHSDMARGRMRRGDGAMARGEGAGSSMGHGGGADSATGSAAGREGGASSSSRMGGRMSGMRMPDLVRIQATPNLVTVSDSSGMALEVIAIGSATTPATASKSDSTAKSTGPGAGDVRQAAGQWQGNQLVVERSGWNNSKVTQTWSLDKTGNTLTVHTSTASDGSRPGRNFDRVYHKVSG